MNDQLKKLYQKVILRHNNEPLHFEKREEATQILEAYNQICGDRFKLYFDVENDRILNFSFHGFGCAISKGSTSILGKHLEGKTIAESKVVVQQFFDMIEGKEVEGEDDFQAFAAAQFFPGRMRCATLSWGEMRLFLV